MTAAARIPFTPADDRVIGQLGTWMTVVAVFHFLLALILLAIAGFGVLGAAALFQTAALVAICVGLASLLWLVSALLAAVEGVLLVQTRLALSRVLTSDAEDQTLISRAIHRLKLFFMLELGFFALNVVIGMLNVVVSWASPETADFGQQMGDMIRGMGGRH